MPKITTTNDLIQMSPNGQLSSKTSAFAAPAQRVVIKITFPVSTLAQFPCNGKQHLCVDKAG